MSQNSFLDAKVTKLNILLVDDDSVDREAVKRSLTKSSVDCVITEATDGKEALEILNNVPIEDNPFLILLDLNMPQMNGLDLLSELSDNEKHKRHLIFVLSTSSDTQDIQASYKHNIVGYFVKSQMDRLIEFISFYCVNP